ncbi:1-phosphofructokinase [Rhizobiaceae bacterium BDR2-2]|uniref:Phosphofructokinase n=1 Tax=Ectorhizobium quercum TaxID=2965071 RepID=A0AAE3MZK7_9HYPH|nr:1-phosphofructokinase [Ectorhizobium quercum]MCX8997361.1 1-phosphofructokinase [Ectorhizobium quercum]
MILRTVTLNPAIDQTVQLDRLVPGEVHRAASVRRNAGGKGVNVASCLADWFGGRARIEALGLLGRDNAAAFEALFADKDIADVMVRVPGETRTNIKLVAAGETTDINLPGFAAGAAALDEVRASLSAVAAGDVAVVSGSLPPGLSEETCADLVLLLRRAGAQVVLDTSGAPLTRALAASAGDMPDVVKPNRHEIEDWAGHPLVGPNDVLTAASGLHDRGVALVVVSLGADGALFCNREGALHARLPEVRGGSSVGAGDAMVAGIAAALAEGKGLEETARQGTAFAAAKLTLSGPNLPGRDEVEALMRRVMITPAADWAAEPASAGANR